MLSWFRRAWTGSQPSSVGVVRVVPWVRTEAEEGVVGLEVALSLWDTVCLPVMASSDDGFPVTWVSNSSSVWYYMR